MANGRGNSIAKYWEKISPLNGETVARTYSKSTDVEAIPHSQMVSRRGGSTRDRKLTEEQHPSWLRPPRE